MITGKQLVLLVEIDNHRLYTSGMLMVRWYACGKVVIPRTT